MCTHQFNLCWNVIKSFKTASLKDLKPRDRDFEERCSKTVELKREPSFLERLFSTVYQTKQTVWGECLMNERQPNSPDMKIARMTTVFVVLCTHQFNLCWNDIKSFRIASLRNLKPQDFLKRDDLKWSSPGENVHFWKDFFPLCNIYC